MVKQRKDAVYVDTRRPRQQPQQRPARAIHVRGQPIEPYQYERLIECWYCGDINTTGRDEGKSSNSAMSATYTMPRRASLGSGKKDTNQYISTFRPINGYRVAPNTGQNGSVKAVKEFWTVTAYLGCKGCGTLLEDN